VNSNKKPTPIIAEASTRMCPVCGKRSYSFGGIHPQCAVHQSDAPRQDKLRAERKAKAEESQQQAETKKCPSCSAAVPLRNKTCECGHEFAATTVTRAWGQRTG
jgi:RNA polymerase subunit RPABC4/transcription elongation factor Spt4